MERNGAFHFFFVDACKAVISSFELIKRRFGYLFEDSEGGKPDPLTGHFYNVIQRSQDERLVQYSRIAQARGTTISEVKRWPLYDYYIIYEDIINSGKPKEDNFLEGE